MSSVLPADDPSVLAVAVPFDHAGDLPRAVGAPTSYFTWHGFVNRLAALVLLMPALPVVAVCWLLVRLGSPGPGFYGQRRVGFHGRVYTLFKIRTMRLDAEAGTGAVWTTSKQDPRITRVGRVLRDWHLDEFPQLWNVLCGEMALVGPRPERPEFVHRLAREIPGYRRRLTVLPGITGLAQINLPPDSDLDSVRRKLIVDLDYIEGGSLVLDLRILACTLGRLLGVRSLWLANCLGLNREHLLPLPSDPSEDSSANNGHSPESVTLVSAPVSAKAIGAAHSIESPADASRKPRPR
jgi:lipopolysaccharide/colanic/teichoic acid biosynthesis glycosyltransferase